LRKIRSSYKTSHKIGIEWGYGISDGDFSFIHSFIDVAVTAKQLKLTGFLQFDVIQMIVRLEILNLIEQTELICYVEGTKSKKKHAANNVWGYVGYEIPRVEETMLYFRKDLLFDELDFHTINYPVVPVGKKGMRFPIN
jgi:hypothetical protein